MAQTAAPTANITESKLFKAARITRGTGRHEDEEENEMKKTEARGLRKESDGSLTDVNMHNRSDTGKFRVNVYEGLGHINK